MAIDTIKFKRGTKNKLDKLSYGEPAYISDEGELYIGTESGIEKLTSNKEVKELSSQLEHIENKQKFDLRVDFGAIGNANYYDSVSGEYYEDDKFTILANDDTQAIKNAIKYSQDNNVCIEIPNGNYKFTSQILIENKRASLKSSADKYRSVFKKCFNGDGIKITTDYTVIDNIRIDCSPKFTQSGSGIAIGDDTTDSQTNLRANYCYIDAFCFQHGEHGIDCMKGNENTIIGHYNQNKKNGVNCESLWVGGSADWNANKMKFSAEGNAQHGLYIKGAEANDIHAVCQGNGWGTSGGYGALIDWVGNYGYIYAEGNVTGGVKFGSSGYGNNFHIVTEGRSNNPISYDNQYNVGYVRSSSNVDFYKLFRLNIKGATTGKIWVSATIPANSYKDFSVNTIYGASVTNSIVCVIPSILLPYGITYQSKITASDTVTIRVCNNTDEDINITSNEQWTVTVFNN